MPQPSISVKIKQIKILRRKVGLSTEHLASLVNPAIETRILEQILESENSIYQDRETITSIEKAIQLFLDQRAMEANETPNAED
jgi:hypothetical protein